MHFKMIFVTPFNLNYVCDGPLDNTNVIYDFKFSCPTLNFK